jgi:tRNA C32,U32 (ribose-2'-O)-methylase TrmJ
MTINKIDSARINLDDCPLVFALTSDGRLYIRTAAPPLEVADVLRQVAERLETEGIIDGAEG